MTERYNIKANTSSRKKPVRKLKMGGSVVRPQNPVHDRLDQPVPTRIDFRNEDRYQTSIAPSEMSHGEIVQWQTNKYASPAKGPEMSVDELKESVIIISQQSSYTRNNVKPPKAKKVREFIRNFHADVINII